MNKINVLDHGFVILRNIAGPSGVGTDRDAPNSARMSFDQSHNDRTEEQDLKLAEYLMKNKHSTPFEMIEIWIEMKMPIFVARQFVRHRTVSINEVSARYVKLPAEWYIPNYENIGFKPKNAKQGRESILVENMTVEQRQLLNSFIVDLNDSCFNSYQNYLNYIENGIAPELARCFLHLNNYTHWLWKQDLHNIMHFLSLRDHSHAQWESQQYAKTIANLLREKLPHTMDLYDKYRRLPE